MEKINDMVAKRIEEKVKNSQYKNNILNVRNAIILFKNCWFPTSESKTCDRLIEFSLNYSNLVGCLVNENLDENLDENLEIDKYLQMLDFVNTVDEQKLKEIFRLRDIPTIDTVQVREKAIESWKWLQSKIDPQLFIKNNPDVWEKYLELRGRKE